MALHGVPGVSRGGALDESPEPGEYEWANAIDEVDGSPCWPCSQHPACHIAMPEAGAIHFINGATMATRVRVGATEFPELAACARVPLGVIGLLDRSQMARYQSVHADIGPELRATVALVERRKRPKRLHRCEWFQPKSAPLSGIAGRPA